MTDSERWFSISLNHFIWTGSVMTLPATGEISLSAVNVELGKASTAQISFNDSAVRTLLVKSSGAIAIADAWGKSNAPSNFNLTISANTQNLNVKNFLIANGWNGTSAVTAVINIAAGVYIWSDSASIAALDTGSSWPVGSTLTINNAGYIMGKGGNGAGEINGVSAYTTMAAYSPIGNPSGTLVTFSYGGTLYYYYHLAGPGGPAISINCAGVTINNTGYILGGGGGGGGAQNYVANAGGGGGGAGGGYGAGSMISSTFGWGGNIGLPGNNGTNTTRYGTSDYDDRGFLGYGGGGGRVPNTNSTAPGGYDGSGQFFNFNDGNHLLYGRGGQQGGGGGGYYWYGNYLDGAAPGGNGGGANNAGGNSTYAPNVNSGWVSPGMSGAGGGGWGAMGGSTTASAPFSQGGPGGKAVALNGYTVTWTTTGTRYGAIS